MAESTTAEARKYLQENGHAVGLRGRLSAEDVAAYTEATGNTVASPAPKSE